MSADKRRFVKVRINATGKRLIGYVDLLAPTYPVDRRTEHPRISDVLNGPDFFLLIQEEEEPSALENDDFRAIPKDALSYVEALDEPENPPALCLEGTLRKVTVELERPAMSLQGELFVPYDCKTSDVLNDPRRFISLRNVQFLDSVERYDYLAVAKRSIVLLKAENE
jgi:hypothetical protein